MPAWIAAAPEALRRLPGPLAGREVEAVEGGRVEGGHDERPVFDDGRRVLPDDVAAVGVVALGRADLDRVVFGHPERAAGVGVEGGKVTHVETTHGKIATRWLINCAGPWLRELGLLAGVDNDEVLLQLDGEEYCFPIDGIEQARIVPQFGA